MFVTTIDPDHKNLSFFWPNDPLGPANFAFECHLAPSSVTVYGDRIQTVTFQSQDADIMNSVLIQPKVSYSECAQFLDMSEREKFALIYRWNILDISPEWMWICTALRHAAKMYVRHNNSLTKQKKTRAETSSKVTIQKVSPRRSPQVRRGDTRKEQKRIRPTNSSRGDSSNEIVNSSGGPVNQIC